MPLRATHILQGTVVSALASIGAFYNWTKHCEVAPLDPTVEPLFKSLFFRRYNPHNNFAQSDVIIRRIPLHHLQPELIEDSRNGGSKLVEHFCGAIWSSTGRLLLNEGVSVSKCLFGLPYCSIPAYWWRSRQTTTWLSVFKTAC
jgi:hypothetical protein